MVPESVQITESAPFVTTTVSEPPKKTNNQTATNDQPEGEKKHKKGGLNCVLKNFFVPYVEVLFSGSESEVVQSLSEFRVVCSG